MKNRLILALLSLLLSSPALAYTFDNDLFKDENGVRNWQHLANTTGSILLILLSIVTAFLFVARRRAYKANRELTAIRNELELRVQERTAMLVEEVSKHIITANQLRSSESYIKDILTSMPLMLVGLDNNCFVTHWNKQVEEVSGISSRDALGKSLWEVYPQSTVLPEHIHESIKHNRIIHLKRSLRSVYHYDITIYPLQEQASGVVILIDDVTKQAAAEQLLIHNDKMSFMGELASAMAYDINIPLQAIMMDLRRFQRIVSSAGQSQLICDSDKAQTLNTIINDMSSKGENVATIISNLLAFARGRNREKQKADIIDLMENTINLANEVVSISDRLPFSQVNLVRKFEKNLPLVPCYITELQQVFLSLFRHACHALAMKKTTEDFEPLINIIISKSYDKLWIKIQHNGHGLTTEEQMSLFEPLYSGKSAEQDFDAGQRLSFSYYIVTEQHQGHMAVTSDVELGSTFHIELPFGK